MEMIAVDEYLESDLPLKGEVATWTQYLTTFPNPLLARDKTFALIIFLSQLLFSHWYSLMSRNIPFLN